MSEEKEEEEERGAGKEEEIKSKERMRGETKSRTKPRGWGVLIYKSFSDLNVTIVQPRHMNFRGRTTLTGSNFFIVRFAQIKNYPFNFYVFQKKTEKKTKEIKGTVFGVCKTNNGIF